ncbi:MULTISPECIES: hypothetical protein [Halolamina]|uniref:Uncharacterized protein n=1 Tax=Halolamina pelagica TaxID=699431 RepID=A0A1I5SWK1_9EURY|nr:MULTISPECIES: hypothetical protein [Halolamina]NHX36891.1 hypothetical protein [Halolamina sp. R1-12]SFP75113.1 hypothetical protein SAMN05216277_10747 [Halolamina pelagica]
MSTPESPGETQDTIRERAEVSTAKLWLYMGADRRLVALGVVSALFLGVVAGGIARPDSVYPLLTDGDPMETLAQALIGSTVTGVTLVLTLSQLVLSQEQGAVGDQRGRMEEATRFRSDVGDLLEDPISPTEPSAFLRSLVGATEQRAEDVASAVEDLEDDELRGRIIEFVDAIRENSEGVRSDLEGARFGEFEVISAALNFNYSWKLYTANRLQVEYADSLSDQASDRLAALASVLELFGPAREHFKTLYFQWELIDLSRSILWTSLPSLLVSTWALLFFDPAPGGVAGVPFALLQAAAVVAVALLPFAVLLSYILRIVTVTKRTLSIGPFILRETDRDVALEE